MDKAIDDEQADKIYYYYVFGCLGIVLFIVIIDLWCCVSGAKLSNEPYYLKKYIEDERQKEITKKKDEKERKEKEKKDAKNAKKKV